MPLSSDSPVRRLTLLLGTVARIASVMNGKDDPIPQSDSFVPLEMVTMPDSVTVKRRLSASMS